VPDILQGMFGGVLCLEVYAAAGGLAPGPVETLGVPLIGALVSVGVSHAAAGALRRLGGSSAIDPPDS